MPAPLRSVFTGRMPFLPPNQQRQSTEGTEESDRAIEYRIYVTALLMSVYTLQPVVQPVVQPAVDETF